MYHYFEEINNWIVKNIPDLGLKIEQTDGSIDLFLIRYFTEDLITLFVRKLKHNYF